MMNINELKSELKIIYDYMVLNQELQKSDWIIGCGCTNLTIPIVCSDLYKNHIAPKILFTGGYGKLTKDYFQKSEAETFRDIALKQGVKEKDIYLETKSTNTVQNFKNCQKIIKKNHEKIIIVCNSIYERRVYNTAKAILKDQIIRVTSERISYEEYFKNLVSSSDWKKDVSVIVGNIQRMIIYPQFGWQLKEEVPKEVLEVYQRLKQKGFNQYIISKEKIGKLVKKNRIREDEITYFE